jgi:hypothetical protein
LIVTILEFACFIFIPGTYAGDFGWGIQIFILIIFAVLGCGLFCVQFVYGFIFFIRYSNGAQFTGTIS